MKKYNYNEYWKEESIKEMKTIVVCKRCKGKGVVKTRFGEKYCPKCHTVVRIPPNEKFAIG